jgi:hypothetical protein
VAVGGIDEYYRDSNMRCQGAAVSNAAAVYVIQGVRNR